MYHRRMKNKVNIFLLCIVFCLFLIHYFPVYGLAENYPSDLSESLRIDPKIQMIERRRRGSLKFNLNTNISSILPNLFLPLGHSPEMLSSMDTVFVQKFILIGNTVFSSQELAKVTRPYENREISFEELQDLRRTLTLYYVNKGYINSGVIIPDQTVVNGVISLRIIEGRLTQIEIEGTRHFRLNYINRRLALAAGPPINIMSLSQVLQRLQNDPRIKRLNAEFKPGFSLGESMLKVRIEENNPYEIWLKVGNGQSPSVGAIKGELQLAHQNLTRNGDSLQTKFGITEGLNDIDISYSFPVTARDASLKLDFRENNSTVIEDIFKSLDIESKSRTYAVTLSRPFYRNSGQAFFLAITAELSHSETYLLGRPFAFSSGSEDGRTDETVLSFSQQWLDRSQIKVMAVNSNFKVGIDALGATINESGVDGKFFSWLGQIQYVRRLKFIHSQIVFRTDIQLTNDLLLPLEKLAIGGMNSVRGYRQNLFVRDNGIVTSLEFRMPLICNNLREDFFQLAPFVDFGRSWNTNNNTPEPKSISSIGLGLLWAITKKINLQVYGGLALRNVETIGKDLQDQGFHFQLIGRLL